MGSASLSSTEIGGAEVLRYSFLMMLGKNMTTMTNRNSCSSITLSVLAPKSTAISDKSDIPPGEQANSEVMKERPDIFCISTENRIVKVNIMVRRIKIGLPITRSAFTSSRVKRPPMIRPDRICTITRRLGG